MPSDVTSPSGTRILEELEKLKATVAEQQSIINRQQAIITSPEVLGRGAPEEKTPQVPQQFKDMREFTDYIQQIVTQSSAQSVDTRMEEWTRNLTPIIKEATKESPVWKTNEMAEKIVNETPGVSMEIAMELAEARMEKNEIAEKERQEEAEKLATTTAAEQASLGHQNAAPGSFDTRPPAEDLSSIMARNWSNLDMDTRAQEHQQQDDIWGSPKTPGVSVIQADIPAS